MLMLHASRRSSGEARESLQEGALPARSRPRVQFEEHALDAASLSFEGHDLAAAGLSFEDSPAAPLPQHQHFNRLCEGAVAVEANFATLSGDVKLEVEVAELTSGSVMPLEPNDDFLEPNGDSNYQQYKDGRAQRFGAFFRERAKSTYGTGTSARQWRAQREEAWDELHFKAVAFAKALLYEVPPPLLGGLFCILIDGRRAAASRALWPPTPANLVVHAILVFAIIAPWLWYVPEVNPIDSLSVALLALAKATTISVKYAFYAKHDLGGESGLGSDTYNKEDRLTRNLMTALMLNKGGHQSGALIEQLYTSTLIQDLHLAELPFEFVYPEDAERVWREVSAILRALDDTDPWLTEVPEDSPPPSSDMKLTESQVGRMESQVDRRALAVGRKFADLSRDQLPSSTSSLEDGRREHSSSSLIDMLLRQTEAEIEESARRGVLSAAIVGIHIVQSCHGVTKSTFCLMAAVVAYSVILALLPVVINCTMGRPPQGIGIAVVVCQVLMLTVYFFIALGYAVMPSLFQYSQRRVDSYLYGMLAGDLAVKSIFPPVYIECSPRIDPTDSRNIAAWAGLQRALRGSHFAPNFQSKFNFYRVITFTVLVVDTLLHGRAAQIYKGSNFPVGSKFASTMRLLSLTAVVTAELGIGMMVNNFADRHVAYLSKLRTSSTALAATTRCPIEREELLMTEHLIDVASQEILNDRASAPVTVAFLKAEITRVSMLLSIVGVVIYQDLQTMRQLAGFS